MHIITKVSSPSNAEHLEFIIRDFHESYINNQIYFETVVPVPGKNDLYRFIVVYNADI